MSRVQILKDADPRALAQFDAVIDVRSPAEFAADHAPGAINLPVLSDAERAEVGEIYVQKSPFLARRIGAAHVARNIAAHLKKGLKEKPAHWRPLIYCWRGGMRSNAMATVLSQVGWRVGVLDGGYRTWRRHVTARLHDGELGLRLVLLDGGTDTAKTEILGLLAKAGVQTLDLEGLARHRGSLFGASPGQPQPGQKLFESRLLTALDALDPTRPVIAEAESNKIGERFIPPALWSVMQSAPRIEIRAPLAERARYLARAYADITNDRTGLDAILSRLPARHGKAQVETWRTMARDGALEALAQGLIEAHYDPAYRRSGKKDEREPAAVVELETLDIESLSAAAARVTVLLDGIV
ncbi:MAG: tRNA 2-selenouridine(34) synthase MnmH [Caulobacteraceae bacterium]